MTDISFNSYTGTFQDVKNIWNEKLWPNRKSTIKEMSSMQYLDGFDMAIYEKYKPTFFIVKHQDKIVGVNSGHRTKDRLYRSRGIWVDPEFRRYGVAQILFDMTEKQAKHILTIPIHQNLKQEELKKIIYFLNKFAKKNLVK